MSVITEQEYRRWSKDHASAWHSVGDQVGIEEIVGLAGDDIADYLHTFLEPTQITDEAHRVGTTSRSILGQEVESWMRLSLNRKRLLTAYPISVTWVHHARCTCTTSTTTGCASVINARQSKVDLSGCAGAGSCTCLTSGDFVTVQLSYYAGFDELPVKLVRAVALLSRHLAKELIVGDGAMDDDLPWAAPQISRSDLGLSRTYKAPPATPFGEHWLGREVQRLCEDYVVVDVEQI